MSAPKMVEITKPTNVAMVKDVLTSIQGNKWININWFTAKLNEKFGVSLTVQQVKRAIPTYVQQRKGEIKRRGRATS